MHVRIILSWPYFLLKEPKKMTKRRIYWIPNHIHSILSSIGAFGWKTERARANSSKPSIPLCFVSNKSNTCDENYSWYDTQTAVEWIKYCTDKFYTKLYSVQRENGLLKRKKKVGYPISKQALFLVCLE